jgi:hypothetical protein
MLTRLPIFDTHGCTIKYESRLLGNSAQKRCLGNASGVLSQAGGENERMVGGCLCRQVRYRAEVEPAFTTVCHCKNCQKQVGTAFTVWVAIPKSSLSVRGTVKTFHGKGDSSRAVERHFCPDCGSPITTDAAALPGLTLVNVGTLDDTSWISPTREIFCDSAQPWVGLSGEMKRFSRMPVG